MSRGFGDWGRDGVEMTRGRKKEVPICFLLISIIFVSHPARAPSSPASFPSLPPSRNVSLPLRPLPALPFIPHSHTTAA